MNAQNTGLPQSGRRIEDVQGHWLLARMGKRVLRPGGLELTTGLLDRLGIAGLDVVELAPGIGRTAELILRHRPRATSGWTPTRPRPRWWPASSARRAAAPSRRTPPTPGCPPAAPMW